MTRGRVHEIMVQSFRHCEIAIKRKPHLEKLLTAGRSAKIVNRRKTIAVDGASQSPDPLTKSVLFKNISNKPFTTRRNSVKTRSIGQSTDTVSNQEVLSVMVGMSQMQFKLIVKQSIFTNWMHFHTGHHKWLFEWWFWHELQWHSINGRTFDWCCR